MVLKYKNKYRIESARLSGYDYSQEGFYFVTICTRDREHYFGEIFDCEMILSDIGRIIEEELLKTSIIRRNVILDEWVIMPNHLHLILKIENSAGVDKDTIIGREAIEGRDALQCVSTVGVSNTQNQEYANKFGPQINNLASIIRGFKGIVTNRVHSQGLFNFYWQSRFYDHIIRNKESLNKIREYIKYNPKMWERDRNNIENLLM